MVWESLINKKKKKTKSPKKATVHLDSSAMHCNNVSMNFSFKKNIKLCFVGKVFFLQ